MGSQPLQPPLQPPAPKVLVPVEPPPPPPPPVPLRVRWAVGDAAVAVMEVRELEAELEERRQLQRAIVRNRDNCLAQLRAEENARLGSLPVQI